MPDNILYNVEEQCNYVLKLNEAVTVDKYKHMDVMRKIVWIVVAVIILGSFVFKDNLFTELSWYARIMLIVIGLGVTFGGRKTVPSPMELHFFDEYLLIYCSKRYYDKKCPRMIFNKMKYSTITDCVYKTKSERLHIYGDLEAVWYDYDKKGNVPSEPTYNRTVKETFWWLGMEFAKDIDFIREIEEHSPIRVRLEES